MIWQQNVRVIVMLTNLVEGMRGVVPVGIAPFGAGAAGAASRRNIAGSVNPIAAAAGVKCGKYWPENIGN